MLSAENWRKQNKSLPARVKTILHHQILTDVLIIVQGKEFRCHRLILSLGSPFFERTFYHTYGNAAEIPPLITSDITPEVFQCVLKFLYTDKVTFANENEAFYTYDAANKFEMDDLKSECEIYLSVNIKHENIWKNLEGAVTLGMENLQKKYVDYIVKNAFECIYDASFLNAADLIVLKLMMTDTLSMTESTLLEKLIEWGMNRCPLQPRLFLRPYLAHVHFKALRAKNFCELIQKYPDILDSHEKLQILQHLELPDKNPLPDWCCQLPGRRWK